MTELKSRIGKRKKDKRNTQKKKGTTEREPKTTEIDATYSRKKTQKYINRYNIKRMKNLRKIEKGNREI